MLQLGLQLAALDTQFLLLLLLLVKVSGPLLFSFITRLCQTHAVFSNNSAVFAKTLEGLFFVNNPKEQLLVFYSIGE
jgi:hypothetical protein